MERIGQIHQPPFDGLAVDLWRTNGITDKIELLADCGELINVNPENVGRLIDLLRVAEKRINEEES
jgi:hypothetical protein